MIPWPDVTMELVFIQDVQIHFTVIMTQKQPGMMVRAQDIMDALIRELPITIQVRAVTI